MLVLALMLILLPFLAAVTGEDPHAPGQAPGAAACVSCHPADAAPRWNAGRFRPCTPYCRTCHLPVEMDRHHKVDSLLQRPPSAVLPLTTDKRTACFTCHDLAQPRFDGVRWKAASLVDRMFRKESRYRTYFLAQRNDQGQLCLACH